MKARSVMLIILFVIVAAVAFGFYRDHSRNASFLAIQPQSSEAEVLKIMGTPSAVEPSCSAYGTQVTTVCDHVLIYKSSFAPVRPQYWLIFFDSNSQATATSSQLAP